MEVKSRYGLSTTYLIDTFERGRFTAEILTLEEAPVARNGVLYYEEETGYPDDIPMYIPMK